MLLRARWLFAWLGVAGVGLIALDATRVLVTDGIRTVRALEQPPVLPGLLLAAVAICGVVAAVLVAARLPDAGRRGEVAALGLGLALTVGLRIALAATLDSPLTGEATFYDEMAHGVLNGQCCFADRPTGYPILLAGAYALIGRGALAGELLNLVAAVVTGLAIYALVRAVLGPRAAVIAVVIHAVWPAGVLMSNTRFTETVYIAGLLLSILAAVGTRPGAAGSAASGLLLALSQYIRPTSLALAPALLLGRLWPSAPWRNALVSTVGPFVLALLLVLLPVLDHNLRAHGEVSPLTSSFGGWSLFVGTNQGKSGGRWNRADWELLPTLSPDDTWRDSKVAGQLGIERIRENIPGFVRLAARKFHTTWGGEDYGVQYAYTRRADRAEFTFLNLLSQAFYVAVTALAALSLFLNRHRLDRLAALTVGATLLTIATHVFLEARDRYHAFLVPLFVCLAAGLIAQWIDSRRLVRRPAPSGTPSASILAP